MYAIGVDLGGTNLRIAAVDENGKLIEKLTTGTQVVKGRDHVIDDMTKAILEVKSRFGSGSSLAGIGIGVPGIIDMDSGMLRESPNLPGWNDYPVREEIERRLGTQVILENDANAAAMGETWLGAAKDCSSMLMYTLGTGVGGGVVLNGGIWHGMNGMAGELGHNNVEPEGHPCNCGSRGCLEQYASATAVVRMAREAIASGVKTELGSASEGGDSEFSARQVYQMSVQGDEVAQEIFRCVGRALGIAISDMVNALNVNMVVIGGGVSSAWESFAPTLFEELWKRSFVYAATAPEQPHSANRVKKTIITRALMGSDAGLYGAARLPMLK